MPTPEIFVLGGPNGAGKSTTATVLLPEALGIEQFVNADLIAHCLSPFAPQTSALEAGRLMLARIHELRSRGPSFAFETTLASRSYVRFLQESQQAGYVVHVAYIWLTSVELALRRVSIRVQQGDHDVPASTVERRYWRGLRNFFELYQPLADTWTLCDNSGDEIVIVARGSRRGAARPRFSPRKNMRRSSGKQPVERSEPDAEFLKQRLDVITEGLKEGIRREVARLRKLGLPIHVAENGRIVDQNETKRRRTS